MSDCQSGSSSLPKVLEVKIVELLASDFLGEKKAVCHACLRFLPDRRTVWLAECAGRHIILKQYHPHPKQKRDASVEWQNAVRLSEAELGVPEPLFFGEVDDGSLVVASEFVANGQTLESAMADPSWSDQEDAIQQLVEMHERQHNFGCYQGDEHLGNYLWSEGRLWLLDAGTYIFHSASLPVSDRMKNMAVLAANVPLPHRPLYDSVFHNHYQQKLPGLAKAVDESIQSRARRFYKKTRRACSAFECQPSKGGTWLACRDIDPALKEKLLDDPDQFFKTEARLKDGNTCTVVELHSAGRSYILKRYNEKSVIYRLIHFFSTPRALLSWSNGHVLQLFGVPTPRPMACLLVQSGRLFRKGYLLMEKVSGVALDAMDEQQAEKLMPEIQNQFLCRWNELDRLSATHGDMKSGNFIFSDQEVLTLIDLDGLQFHRTASEHLKKKRKDKMRFLRNWERHTEWSQSFRQAVKAIELSS